MRRRRVIVSSLVAVTVVVGAVVAWRVLGEEESRFSEAVALAPDSSLRYSWTDWAGVRTELGMTGSTMSSDEVADLLDEAFDRDLASASALEASATTIHDALGFSPATVDWELFAQGEDGALVLMGLPDDADLDALRERLREVGYEEPEEEDGVWVGGVDLLESLAGPVTPELAVLQIDEDEGVLAGSDEVSTLESRAEEARGDLDDGLAAAVAASGEALSAVAYTGDQACTELSMTDAEPADRTRAAELVDAAGGIHPLTGFVIAAEPGGAVRTSLAFETADQARADADARSTLAAGPAPGQGGTFPERFALGDVVARDQVVTMEMTPVDGTFVVSDLSHGPVLFATC